jgi:hypothetical protein
MAHNPRVNQTGGFLRRGNNRNLPGSDLAMPWACRGVVSRADGDPQPATSPTIFAGYDLSSAENLPIMDPVEIGFTVTGEGESIFEGTGSRRIQADA